MPKIGAKSGEIIEATTSPVDKMNRDRALPILSLQSWFGRRKQTQSFFLIMHLGERELSLLRKKLLALKCNQQASKLTLGRTKGERMSPPPPPPIHVELLSRPAVSVAVSISLKHILTKVW